MHISSAMGGAMGHIGGISKSLSPKSDGWAERGKQEIRTRRGGEQGLIFASLGTVLVDEFEFLPAPGETSGAVPMPEASLALAHVSTPDGQVSLIPPPRAAARTPLPRATSSGPSTPMTSTKPNDHTSDNSGAALPASALALDPRTIHPADQGLVKSARPSPAPSTATSRSMTPQLSFDELDATPAASSGPLEGHDLDGLLTLRCGSPVASSSNEARAGATAVVVRKEEHLGGGGLYALQGARLWLLPEQCKALVDRQAPVFRLDTASAVDPGVKPDMTPEQEEQLARLSRGSWDYLEGEGKRMVRARIRYEGDARRFQHLIKPYPRSFASIASTALRGARYIHVSPPYAPSDMCQLLDEIDLYHTSAPVPDSWRPKIVYEPTPPSCMPEQRVWLEKCCSRIHILSPNHEELLCLFSRDILPISDPALPGIIEEIMRYLLDLGIGPDGCGAIIVRCGRMGSVVGTRKAGIRWLPAFWTEAEEERVVDVTGAGNAYLGGAIAGLFASNDDPIEAALYGTISASFAVEQKGLPTRTRDQEEGEDGVYTEEEWNGDLPSARLAALRARCGL